MIADLLEDEHWCRWDDDGQRLAREEGERCAADEGGKNVLYGSLGNYKSSVSYDSPYYSR